MYIFITNHFLVIYPKKKFLNTEIEYLRQKEFSFDDIDKFIGDCVFLMSISKKFTNSIVFDENILVGK